MAVEFLGNVFKRAFARKSRDLPFVPLDPITHLPSRAAIIAELTRSLIQARHKRPTALVIVEFSNLLKANGDETPDEAVIRRLGTLLRSWIPEEQTVGHMRGREFALLLRNVSIRDVEHMADHIVDNVRQDPMLKADHQAIATIVGVGYSSRSDAQASQLMAHADIALHYAQATGRGWHAIVDKVVIEAA